MNFIFRSLSKSYCGISCRGFHASCSVQKDAFAKFMFNAEGYNKYGLLRDDLLSEFHSLVSQAVERLPEEEKLQRTYRAIRAFQAELNHTLLPKDQWTKFEDNHDYLQPYMKEVIQEKKEIEEWNANH